MLPLQTTLNHWGRPVDGGSALEKHDNDWTRTQVILSLPSNYIQLPACLFS